MTATDSAYVRSDSAHWLSADRLRLGAVAVLVLQAWAMAIGIWLPPDFMHLGPQPLGSDFTAFWGVSHLVLDGDAAAAYGPDGLVAAQHAGAPANDSRYGWFYPPLFLLIVAPLAALPYLPAYLLWVSAGVGLALRTVWSLAPSRTALLAMAAFPGMWMTAMHGQNGGLLLACFGGAMALIDRRPVAAGILIGLMSFKPQFGVLIPLALICGGRWRVFWAAAACAVVAQGLALAVFGWETGIAFLASIGDARLYLEAGDLPWAKMPGPLVFALAAGAGGTLAYAVHIAVALGIAGAVALVWRRRAPMPLAAAVLACGAVIVTPFAYDYDMILLAVPIALMAWHGARTGDWLRGERAVLALAWTLPLWPFAGQFLLPATGVQPMTLPLLALFAVATAKALRATAAPSG